MEFDLFQIELELIKIMSDPKQPQNMKEKAIEKLACESVEIHPNFGAKTKKELKAIITASSGARETADSVLAYLSTHNCNE